MNKKWQGILMAVIVGVLAVNQYAIGQMSGMMGTMSFGASLSRIFSVSGASAQEIWMPMLNDDGLTTHLQLMPTITEVSDEPGGNDLTAAAMTVMIATGSPTYAPDGASFDDPVGAMSVWGAYEKMPLSDNLESRYQEIISRFTCNFCCGSPGRVTINGRCGCAHARAARGFFRYMLNNYSSTYTDDQLFGEAYRWQAIWYPKGVVEDYLLATGRGNVLGHDTHGGAGADGLHGLSL